jgi:hypothetical protein
MSSYDKLKHKNLTLCAKVEIIKKLDKDEKLINLAKEDGVGCATMYDNRKNGGIKINLFRLFPVICHFW